MPRNIPTRGDFQGRHINPQNPVQQSEAHSAPRLLGRLAFPFTQTIRTVVWASPVGMRRAPISPAQASAEPFEPWTARRVKP